MIDTIRLVKDVEKFPASMQVYESRKGVSRKIINPSGELKGAGYYPNITCVKRPVAGGISRQLQIEFSIPKILFNNNFCEVEDSNFFALLSMLSRKLAEMQISLSPDELASLRVQKIDYAKNILLRDGLQASYFIRLIHSASLGGLVDVSCVDYRNGGRIIRFHTNRHEDVFYDKLFDLKRSCISEKRCVEKNNAIQCQLVRELEAKHLSVLRFEVRLNGVSEIKKTLSKAGVEQGRIDFRSLYSSDIARKVLLSRWSLILNCIPKARLSQKNPMDDLNEAALSCATPMQTLALVGLRSLQREGSYDPVFISNLLSSQFSSGTWTRINKRLPKDDACEKLGRLLFITKSIKEMKAIRAEEL